MTKTKSTKSALLLSAISLLMCVSMLVGSTFAWFTDSVNTTLNKIQSGNLDVDLLYWDMSMGAGADFISLGENPDTKLFKNVNGQDILWEPEASGFGQFTVVNKGSLALKYELKLNFANATATPTGKTLADVLTVYAIARRAETGEDGKMEDADLEDLITNGIDSTIDGYEFVALKDFIMTGYLLPGESFTYELGVYWKQSENDNEFNVEGGLSMDFGVTLLATQMTYENDAYGDDYDEDAEYPVTATELAEAFAKGGLIKLKADIEGVTTLTVPEGVAVTLDMNGKTISTDIHKDEGPVIKNNGTLTIIGGTITSKANNGGSAIVNNGMLTVKDAVLNGAPNADGSWPSYAFNNTGVANISNTKFTSYHGSVSSYGEGAVVTLNDCEIDMAGIPGFTSHGIYTYNSGKVVVNGGTYANNATDQNSSGASVINGAVTINGGTFSGRIENYYGTPVINAGTFDRDPSARVSTGSTVNDNGDGTWTVSMTQANDNASINDALEAGKNVQLSDDVKIEATTESTGYGATGVKVTAGQIFDGNGNTLSVPGANKTWDSAVATTGGTIQNLTIDAGFRGIFMPGASADVYINNVIIDGPVYTFNSDAGNKNYGVYISNSTLNGWTSFSDVHKEVIFTNCNFGEGSGYAFCRPYNATSFVNCNFEAGFEIDARAAITFENCYLDGVLITAENVATLVTGGAANATVIQ